MKTIAVVDVETTPITPGRIPRTKFWGVTIEGEGYSRFKTTEQMIAFVSKRPELRCYFHHDYEICQLLVDKYVPQSLKARGSRIIRANVAGTEWINSFALFPSSLEEILKCAGFKKLPLSFGDHPLTCLCLNCQRALEARNESDCSEALVAFRALSTAYYRAFGIDPIESGFGTAAGCSFAAAEMVAGKMPTDLDWRDCYRGGRTEAFRIGNVGKAEAWDINSSYPFSFTDAPNRDVLLHCYVDIKAPVVSPFFRYAPEDTERTFLFPAGSYETIFFASNYEKYIRPHAAGIVKRIQVLERVPVNLEWVKNVGPMMQRAYDMRLKAKATKDESLSYSLKVGMNSAYGRIGMKPVREIVSISENTGDPNGSYRELPDGRFLVFKSAYLSSTKANYPMAGWITDNARARLFAALATSDPYYCDTDSVYCRPSSLGNSVVRGNGLGAWKLEKIAKLSINTVKDYSFGKDTKRKGGFGYNRWTIKSVLAGKGVQHIDKTPKTFYDKREIWPDGSTTPLPIAE